MSCVNCGKEIGEGAGFCPFCTAFQNDKYENPPKRVLNYFRVVLLPLQYCYSIVLFVLKWIIVAPPLFIVYLLRHTFWAVIIGALLAYFISPTVGAVIYGIITLFYIKRTAYSMGDGFFGEWEIYKDYMRKMRDKNEVDDFSRMQNRNRRLYIRKVSKDFKTSKALFDGFNTAVGLISQQVQMPHSRR